MKNKLAPREVGRLAELPWFHVRNLFLNFLGWGYHTNFQTKINNVLDEQNWMKNKLAPHGVRKLA